MISNGRYTNKRKICKMEENKENQLDNPQNLSNTEESKKLLDQPPKIIVMEKDIKEDEDVSDDQSKTFDDILVHLGEFGRYQKIVYFLLFLPTIFSAMHKMAWVFLGAKVNHRCRLPFEATEEIVDADNTIFYNSSTNLKEFYKWDEDNDRFHQCSWIDKNKNEQSCNNGWIYDRTTFGSSAVMEWNLVN